MVGVAELEVTPRHILRLRAEFKETGSVHVPRLPGKPALQPPSQGEVKLLLDFHRLEKVGVLRTVISLRRAGHNTIYRQTHHIMEREWAGRTIRSKVAKA